MSQPSSSRGARPASEAAFAPSGPPSASASSRRQRASHAVQSSPSDMGMPLADPGTPYDVYTHPKALAYQQAHPRRALPKFGPYLLLQTLGEGEFGKVKLGLHEDWGEEVAVKLIRRGSVDNSVRLSKVEREIEVLKNLRHPNIVRLYDVIETDKYIGIILEYASGGELFDHILAHRYLRERDACRLFAQLISGVWYIHQKKIVHRDLKLENLLLDRNRNVIITDFGFANRFEHPTDDLMSTSCGSPCYAAPELVISEGAYVGSAVDVWSCGVILYAMLAGYLPFDDDPSNPDGDNINLLYRYIVSTPLTFPDYVSQQARDLLGIMLVPDPAHRASLSAVMRHEWLAPYRMLFDRSVAELEAAAAEAARAKREQYMRQARAARQAALQQQQQQGRGIARSQTTQPGGMATLADQRRGGISGSATADFTMYDVQESGYIAPSSGTSSRRAVASAVVMPTTAVDEDEMMEPADERVMFPTGSSDIPPRTRKESQSQARGARPAAPATGPPPSTASSAKRRAANRHTVQVEYDKPTTPEPFPPAPPPSQPLPPVPTQQPQRPQHRTPPVLTTAHGQPEIIIPSSSGGAGRRAEAPAAMSHSPSQVHQPSTPQGSMRRKAAAGAAQQAQMITPKSPQYPSAPHPSPATPRGPPTSPLKRAPATEPAVPTLGHRHDEPPVVGTPPVPPALNGTTSSASTASSSGKSGRHRKGLSIEKFGSGIGKMLSGKSSNEPVQQQQQTPTRGQGSMPPVAGRPQLSGRSSSGLGSSEMGEKEREKEKKKSRRTTLTGLLPENPFTRKEKPRPPVVTPHTAVSRPSVGVTKPPPPITPDYSVPPLAGVRGISPSAPGPPVSTGAARQVMNWFRKKSQAKNGTPGQTTPSFEKRESSSTVHAASGPHVVVTSAEPPSSYTAPQPISIRGPPKGAASPTPPAANSPVAFNKQLLRVHDGSIDQAYVTTGYPPVVFQRVTQVLQSMGVEIQKEMPFKYRCIRHKRRRSGGGGMTTSNTGLGFSGMINSPSGSGSALTGYAMSPPQHTSSASGGMLKGLLMRRSSNNPAPSPILSPALSEESPIMSPFIPGGGDGTGGTEPLYGDPTIDKGDEVRFSVELTRVDRLEDTYTLDIRRLKGGLGGYKFVYETLRDRLNLNQ